MEMNRWLLLHFIYIPDIRPIWIHALMRLNSCIKYTNKTPSLIYPNFTMLNKQELFFIWYIYKEANILKLHFFRCNNDHLFISTHW